MSDYYTSGSYSNSNSYNSGSSYYGNSNSYNSGYSSSYHSSSNYNSYNNNDNGDDGTGWLFIVVFVFVALAMQVCSAGRREINRQEQVERQRQQRQGRHWQQQTTGRAGAAGCSSVAVSTCGGGSAGSTARKEYWTPVTEQKLTGINAAWPTLTREFERKVGRAVENVTHELMQQEADGSDSSEQQQQANSPKDGVYNVSYKIKQNGGTTTTGNILDNTLTVQFQMKILFGTTNRGGWGVLGVGQSGGRCGGSRYHGLMTKSGKFFFMEDTSGRHPTIKIISLLEGQYDFTTSSVVNGKWSSIHGDRNVETTLTLDAQTVPVAPATLTDELTGTRVDLSEFMQTNDNDDGNNDDENNPANDITSLPVVEAQPVSAATGEGGSGRATVVVESSLRSIV